jgi:serine/threonine protein kinase
MNDIRDVAGRVFHGFRVQKPIGQGKFSVVYRAEQVADNAPVALKMIKVLV